jgi:hypothetical protein
MKRRSVPHAVTASLTGVIVLATLGCSPELESNGKTVDYYRTHEAERLATLRACGNDPGRLREATACVNAKAAEREFGIGSLRRLPSMGLLRPLAETQMPDEPQEPVDAR